MGGERGEVGEESEEEVGEESGEEEVGEESGEEEVGEESGKNWSRKRQSSREGEL